jgi:HYR domain
MILKSAAHWRTFSRPHPAKVWLAACAALIGASLVPFASARAVGALTLSAQVDITYPAANCAPGTPVSVSCFTRTGVSLVRGLGKVEQSYAYLLDERPAACPQDHVRGLPSTARLTVAGKGTIEIRVSGTDCLLRQPPAPVTGTETFTVTGGSGKYTGASGSGTIAHISNGPPTLRGTDTWTGTLAIPALEFDLTPPVIRGAVAKTARAQRGAQRARVRFNVSATDNVDGSVAVACTPKSGSRFRIGRTRVRCSAMDSSANRTTAGFTITVAKARKVR